MAKVTLEGLDKMMRFMLERMATKEDLQRFATKDDLAKLESRMATKDDLKGFATKEDLQRFATKEDLERFATKEDIRLVRSDIVQVKLDTGELRTQYHRLESNVALIRERVTLLAEGSEVRELRGRVEGHDRDIGALQRTVGEHDRQLRRAKP